jgi:superfamily II DNA or RNA helicase
MDEAHHILVTNKWGKAVDLFPNALGLGVTATPGRADGKGLGRHADGVFDVMVEGPTLRRLINSGFLTDYDIALPESDLDLVGLDVTASGDYSQKKLTERVKKSHLIGDIVKEYAKHARGRLAVVFMESIETAGLVAAQFNNSGIKAAVVSSKNSDSERVQTVRRFANRELDVLVNVDLFGEGYDLPAIEVVIMGRATQSYGLYVQQFGRTLRKMEGKGKALIIDHVGNVLRHGLPDSPKAWSLDAREKRKRKKFDEDDIPLKRCDECTRPYEAVLIACPYCHAEPKPMRRGKVSQVDGDLFLLDPSILAQMRGEVERIDEDPAAVMNRVFHAAGTGAAIVARDRHAQRQRAQAALRAAMSWWSGFQVKQERCQREAQRRFFYRYGIDPVSARALGTEDAHKLKAVIIRDLQERRV